MPSLHRTARRSRRGLMLCVGALLVALTSTSIATAVSTSSSESTSVSGAARSSVTKPASVPAARPLTVLPVTTLPVTALPVTALPVTTWPPVVYRSLSLVRPHRGGNVIYLTFDDGPHRYWTPRILGLLKRYHAQATFFVIGRNVRNNPKIVTAEAKAGHRVENHSNTHPDLRRIQPDGLLAYKQLRPVNTLIRRLTGRPATCMRPPYGSYDARVRRIAGGLGLHIAMWTLDTLDWSHPGVGRIVHVATRARGGSIVLMHDGIGGVQTYRALRTILARLSARGFVFRSLC